MWRKALILLVALCLAPGTWLRTRPVPGDPAASLVITALRAGPDCCRAGPFRLAGAWQLTSRHPFFGGYSALLSPRPGRLLALSDRGYLAEFGAPGQATQNARFAAVIDDTAREKGKRDVESATLDPHSGSIWVGLEGPNAISRYGPGLIRETFRKVPEMRGWPSNGGPEAMVRLRDGRFIALCECTPGWLNSGVHEGFLFASDPSAGGAGKRFVLRGAPGYLPTDLAELPDGRVLILARRLTWPFPARFSVRILIADPAGIAGGEWRARELAELGPEWPMDNYEGLAITPKADGTLVAWIISDDNGAVFQRSLLLKLEFESANLPPKQKAPGLPRRL